jgi:hypothetical protein
MIKRILLAALLGSAVFFACNTTPKKELNNPNECTKYACPMHPDHTSTTPAKCPECSMDMEPVKDPAKQDSTKNEDIK